MTGGNLFWRAGGGKPVARAIVAASGAWRTPGKGGGKWTPRGMTGGGATNMMTEERWTPGMTGGDGITSMTGGVPAMTPGTAGAAITGMRTSAGVQPHPAGLRRTSAGAHPCLRCTIVVRPAGGAQGMAAPPQTSSGSGLLRMSSGNVLLWMSSGSAPPLTSSRSGLLRMSSGSDRGAQGTGCDPVWY